MGRHRRDAGAARLTGRNRRHPGSAHLTGRHRRDTGGAHLATRRRPEASKDPAGEGEVLGMAGGAGLNFVGAAFRQVAVAGIFLMLSRWLGPAGVGTYAQAFALLSVLALLSHVGLQAGLTRFVAVHLADGDRKAVFGTVRLGLVVPTASALILGAGLYVAAPWIVEGVFDDPGLLMPLRYAACTLPAITFMEAALAATRGLRTMRAFALIGWMVEPTVRLGLTFGLVIAGFGLRGAMIALLVSHVVGAILAGWALRRLLGPPALPPSYHPSDLFGFSVMSWGASLATSGLIWADTILLGVYGSSEDVGLYNVATRLVILASLAMRPINAAFAPRIADLHQRGHTTTLEGTYRMATSWIVRLSLPAFIVVIAFPGDLLALFGAEFVVVGASTATVILAAGKLVDATSGPCNQMLVMSGRPVPAMVNNIVVLFLNIGLNIWLIPRYGILGAAVAWGVSLCLVNLLRLVQVWSTMRMVPFGPGLGKALVAGAVISVPVWAAQGLVVGAGSLLTAAVVIAAAYAGLVAALGVGAQDRLVLRAAASRVLRRRDAGPGRTRGQGHAPDTSPARTPRGPVSDDE